MNKQGTSNKSGSTVAGKSEECKQQPKQEPDNMIHQSSSTQQQQNSSRLHRSPISTNQMPPEQHHGQLNNNQNPRLLRKSQNGATIQPESSETLLRPQNNEAISDQQPREEEQQNINPVKQHLETSPLHSEDIKNTNVSKGHNQKKLKNENNQQNIIDQLILNTPFCTGDVAIKPKELQKNINDNLYYELEPFYTQDLKQKQSKYQTQFLRLEDAGAGGSIGWA